MPREDAPFVDGEDVLPTVRVVAEAGIELRNVAVRIEPRMGAASRDDKSADRQLVVALERLAREARARAVEHAIRAT